MIIDQGVLFWLIVVFFVMWEVAFFEIHDDVSDMVPMVRAFGWTSAWEAYCSIVKELYARLVFTCSYLQYSPDDRGRAILKPGIAPHPFVPIRYDPGGSIPARNPRRANAKELRRAYDRAREELRTLEREARPKERKTN